MLPDVIIGLSIHCALNSRHLIERLILNFPEKWPAVYESVLEHISITKTNPEHNTRCLAALHHLSTFVPDTNSLLNKFVSIISNLVVCIILFHSNFACTGRSLPITWSGYGPSHKTSKY